ncbi:MAG: hypothetical protein ACK559_40430, partial [bacterium]
MHEARHQGSYLQVVLSHILGVAPGQQEAVVGGIEPVAIEAAEVVEVAHAEALLVVRLVQEAVAPVQRAVPV